MELVDIMQFVMIGALTFFVLKKRYGICPCPICHHMTELSEETIKDIIEEALPESKGE